MTSFLIIFSQLTTSSTSCFPVSPHTSMKSGNFFIIDYDCQREREREKNDCEDFLSHIYIDK